MMHGYNRIRWERAARGICSGLGISAIRYGTLPLASVSRGWRSASQPTWLRSHKAKSPEGALFMLDSELRGQQHGQAAPGIWCQNSVEVPGSCCIIIGPHPP